MFEIVHKDSKVFSFAFESILPTQKMFSSIGETFHHLPTNPTLCHSNKKTFHTFRLEKACSHGPPPKFWAYTFGPSSLRLQPSLYGMPLGARCPYTYLLVPLFTLHNFLTWPISNYLEKSCDLTYITIGQPYIITNVHCLVSTFFEVYIISLPRNMSNLT
jgi:hypothetical protein